MNCERCGTKDATNLGATAGGSWWRCLKCGHAFITRVWLDAAPTTRSA